MLAVDASKADTLHPSVSQTTIDAERQYWKSIDIVPRYIELTRTSGVHRCARHYIRLPQVPKLCSGGGGGVPVYLVGDPVDAWVLMYRCVFQDPLAISPKSHVAKGHRLATCLLPVRCAGWCCSWSWLYPPPHTRRCTRSTPSTHAGTAYGAVGVFKLRSLHARPPRRDKMKQPLLIFSYFPPKRRSPPIVSLRWSTDGASQLVAVDGDNKVRCMQLAVARVVQVSGQPGCCCCSLYFVGCAVA